jgi:maltodextrin utilization protein YvdJ
MHKLQWYENKYPIIFLYGLLINHETIQIGTLILAQGKKFILWAN